MPHQPLPGRGFHRINRINGVGIRRQLLDHRSGVASRNRRGEFGARQQRVPHIQCVDRRTGESTSGTEPHDPFGQTGNRRPNPAHRPIADCFALATQYLNHPPSSLSRLITGSIRPWDCRLVQILGNFHAPPAPDSVLFRFVVARFWLLHRGCCATGRAILVIP